MSKAIIKIGDNVLRDYFRVEAMFNRADGSTSEPRFYVYRKKIPNSFLEDVYEENVPVDIVMYENEEALENDEPVDIYRDMIPLEWGIVINPPNYSIQEKISFGFGDNETSES